MPRGPPRSTLSPSPTVFRPSAHPESPHYGDQTRFYAAEAWWPLPFTEAEIAADPALTVTRLTR